jgi:hypothetical protein
MDVGPERCAHAAAHLAGDDLAESLGGIRTLAPRGELRRSRSGPVARGAGREEAFLSCERTDLARVPVYHDPGGLFQASLGDMLVRMRAPIRHRGATLTILGRLGAAAELSYMMLVRRRCRREAESDGAGRRGQCGGW